MLRYPGLFASRVSGSLCAVGLGSRLAIGFCRCPAAIFDPCCHFTKSVYRHSTPGTMCLIPRELEASWGVG